MSVNRCRCLENFDHLGATEVSAPFLSMKKFEVAGVRLVRAKSASSIMLLRLVTPSFKSNPLHSNAISRFVDWLRSKLNGDRIGILDRDPRTRSG